MGFSLLGFGSFTVWGCRGLEFLGFQGLGCCRNLAVGVLVRVSSIATQITDTMLLMVPDED